MLASSHAYGGQREGQTIPSLSKEGLAELEQGASRSRVGFGGDGERYSSIARRRAPAASPPPGRASPEITPFPRIRSILWNRAYIAEPTNLTVPELRVMLGFEPARLLAAAGAGFLLGSVTRNNNALTVKVDRFDPGQEATAGIDAETNDHPSAGGNSADTRRHQRQPLVALPGDYCIAVSNTAAAASSSSSSNGDGNTARNMMPDRSALNTEACDRITRCCRLGITSVSDVFGVRGSCGGGSGGGGSSGGGGHVKLSVRAVCPDTVFTATAVPQLPVVRSGLVRKINIITDAGSTLAVSDPEIGFLTMDSTRNVVLVHGNDPQVEKRPIIGAYAAAVDGISDPMVWAACLQFLRSSKVRDRAVMQDGSFLLAIYPSVTHKETTAHAPFRNSATFYEVREAVHATPGADGFLTLADDTLLDAGAGAGAGASGDGGVPVSLRLVSTRSVITRTTLTEVPTSTSAAERTEFHYNSGSNSTLNSGGSNISTPSRANNACAGGDASLDDYLRIVSGTRDQGGGGAVGANQIRPVGVDLSGGGDDEGKAKKKPDLSDNNGDQKYVAVAGTHSGNGGGGGGGGIDPLTDDGGDFWADGSGAEEHTFIASNSTAANGTAGSESLKGQLEEPKQPPTPSALALHPAADLYEFDVLRLSVRESVGGGDTTIASEPTPAVEERGTRSKKAPPKMTPMDIAYKFTAPAETQAKGTCFGRRESTAAVSNIGIGADVSAVVEEMQTEITMLRQQLAEAKQQVLDLTATAAAAAEPPPPPPPCCDTGMQTDDFSTAAIVAHAQQQGRVLPLPTRTVQELQPLTTATTAAAAADAVVHSAVEQVQSLLEGLLQTEPQPRNSAVGGGDAVTSLACTDVSQALVASTFDGESDSAEAPTRTNGSASTTSSPSRVLVRKMITVRADNEGPASVAPLSAPSSLYTPGIGMADEERLLARAEARSSALASAPAPVSMHAAHPVSVSEAIAVAEAAGYVASALPPSLWQSKSSSVSMGATSGADWGSGSTDSSALGSSGPSLNSSMLCTGPHGVLGSTMTDKYNTNSFNCKGKRNPEYNPKPPATAATTASTPTLPTTAVVATNAASYTDSHGTLTADTSFCRKKADAIVRKYLGDDVLSSVSERDLHVPPSAAPLSATAAMLATDVDESGEMILDASWINALPKFL